MIKKHYDRRMQGIFLYGGCVIRDAYEQLKDDVKLTGYVSRQSLITATTPASTILPAANLDSPFQQRAANGDIRSNLIPLMREAAASTSLFVMDFHVERLGVHKLPDGSFITASNEIVKSGVLKTLDRKPGKILLGSERHTGFWTHAARRFYARVKALGIQDKVLIIDAPWATHATDGTELGHFHGRPIAEVSENISELTQTLAGYGLNVATMPREHSVSPTNHKWGTSPFHFGEPAMDWVSEQMLKALK